MPYPLPTMPRPDQEKPGWICYAYGCWEVIAVVLWWPGSPPAKHAYCLGHDKMIRRATRGRLLGRIR